MLLQLQADDLVDLLLDRVELSLAAGVTDRAGERMQGIQRVCQALRTEENKFARGGEQGRQDAEHHRTEEERIAVLVEEAFLRVLVKSGGAGMHRNERIL